MNQNTGPHYRPELPAGDLRMGRFQWLRVTLFSEFKAPYFVLALTTLQAFYVAAPAQGAEAPAPQVAGRLPFGQAIDMAVSSSPKRAAAQADLDAEAAKRREAFSDFGPKVRAEFNAMRFDKTVALPFGPDVFTIRPNQLRQGDLIVSQPITGLFTAYERASLAGVQKNASELAVASARADAAFGAAEAYRRAQQADEFVRIAEASIASTDSQARDAEHLESSGRLIRSDLLKINIARQDARAQLAKAVAVKRKAHDRLRYLLGLQSGQDPALDPLPTTAAAATKYALPTPDAANDRALKGRVEVKQAALGVERASYATTLSRWRFAPNVDLFAKWDRIYSEPPFGNPEFTRSYGVSASWDIWDNGAKIFATQVAAAETQKAEIAQKETSDQLRLQIEGILADLGAAKESLAAAQATVAQAEEAYRLDKARFSSGLVTTTDLLLSETSQTKARGGLVSAITDFDLLTLSLDKAMGEPRPK